MNKAKVSTILKCENLLGESCFWDPRYNCLIWTDIEGKTIWKLNENNQSYKFNWIDRIGEYIIKEVILEIGGQEIDKHTKEWLQVWAELSTPESKAVGYKYMTGGQSNPLVTGGGTNQQSIIVPLQFYFCRNVGLALPLIALQYSEIKLKFTNARSKSNISCEESIIDVRL